MKRILPLLAFVFVSIFAFGQSLSPEVISSGGDYSEGENASLSWTLGELATETLTAGDVILTQGFQQNSFTITAIEKSLYTDFSVTLYPNPVRDYLTIQIDSELSKEYHYELVDMNGNSITMGKIQNNFVQIPLNDKSLSSQMYIVRILDKRNKMIKGFKLFKGE